MSLADALAWLRARAAACRSLGDATGADLLGWSADDLEAGKPAAPARDPFQPGGATFAGLHTEAELQAKASAAVQAMREAYVTTYDPSTAVPTAAPAIPFTERLNIQLQR